MPDTPIGRLRLLGLIEGVSYLLLLGVAMPLKYLAGRPEMVTYVGWAHGVLFVALCGALLLAWYAARWSLWQSAAVFVAALLPFGPFVIDRRLRVEEEAYRRRWAASGAVSGEGGERA